MSKESQAKIILLNGASSSGKSSIALALQASIDQPFWHISIDHLRDAGVLPLDRIRSGEFPWPTLRSAFFEGFHRSLAAYAQAGNNLIVEHIIETPQWLQRLGELLRPFDVFLVGVHCPLEELEQRERARGDRPLGDARSDFATIHAFVTYDLELDAMKPPAANARRVIDAWRYRQTPSGFERLLENKEI